MPALLVTIFSGFVQIFNKYILSKFVNLAIFSTMFLALFVSAIAVADNAISSLLSHDAIYSSEYWIIGVSLLPSNSVFCISAIVASHTSAFLFRYKSVLLKFWTRIGA